jgi:hypothetical protein
MSRIRVATLTSIAFFAALALAIEAACSVDVDLAGKGCPCPDDLFCDTTTNTCVRTLSASTPDGGPPPAACNEAEGPCTTNDECRDPARRYCGAAGTCVECLATPSDTCTAGGHCNEKNQCVVGCKVDAECQVATNQRCNTSTHRCVDCLVDADCTAAGPSSKCSPSGQCATSCNSEGAPCGTGGTCCGGFCLSLSADVLNCGQCGKACSTVNNTPSCTAGQCSFNCADGYGHCLSPFDNSGCETIIRSTTNCGSCGAACSPQTIVFANGIACAGSACTYTTCQQGHVDDDRNPANGCEATCGGRLERCCPAPQNACNNGDACKVNGTCPNP